MGASPQAQLMQRLQAALASRGAPGVATGTPGGGPGLASAVSAQLASLRGADPTVITRQLEEMEKTTGALITQTMQTVPGVAAALAPVIKALQRAKKEAQQALQTAQATGPGLRFGPAMNSSGPETGGGPEMTG